MKTRYMIATAFLCFGGCATEGGAPDDVTSDEAAESQAARIVSPHEIANATFSDCPAGDLCFYTGLNGTGKMCHWGVIDPDWASGQIVCSWALTNNVCSIFNRWTGTVDYYTSPNYVNHIGSTARDVAGNLACSYKLRSHR